MKDSKELHSALVQIADFQGMKLKLNKLFSILDACGTNLYRYNETKTLDWLERKFEKLLSILTSDDSKQFIHSAILKSGL